MNSPTRIKNKMKKLVEMAIADREMINIKTTDPNKKRINSPYYKENLS
jgi:hypothetical protein